MFNRVFLVVLDSLGFGATDDASFYGDKGAITLLHTIKDNYIQSNNKNQVLEICC